LENVVANETGQQFPESLIPPFPFLQMGTITVFMHHCGGLPGIIHMLNKFLR